MLTLFESIENIIAKIEPAGLHLNLMLFNPRDGNYHTYLSHPVKEINEEDWLDEWNEELNKNKGLKSWLEEWKKENTGGEPKNKLKFDFSSLPGKENWDVNGFYHKIFIDKKEYENSFTPEKPAYWFYKENKITCYQLEDSKLKVALNERDYDSDFGENTCNYKLYQNLYNLLRENIFTEANFEKIITVPLFLNGSFSGIAFSQAPGDKNEIINALKEYEKIPPLIQPALQNLLLSEFDKFVLKGMDKFKTFQDIIKTVCENINFILRCQYVMCSIKHPELTRETNINFTWSEEKPWKKIFKFKENLTDPEADPWILQIEFPIQKWNVNLKIYPCLTGNDPFLKEMLTQLLNQKLISIINPIYENLRKARKSATLQIMSRNTAHGIGARVLSHLSTPDALENSMKKLVDSEPNKSQYEQYKHLSHLIEYIRHQYKHLSHLIEYIRQRFNTIADIATSGFNILTDKKLSEEINFFYDSQTRTLSNPVIYFISRDSSGVNKLSNIITEDEDKTIAIPNDIYGVHAFFIILENIIRNIAKHMKDKIALKITVSDYNNKYYRVEISHLCSGGNSYKLKKESINKIREYISSPVLHEKDKPRAGGWGLLEMKICAAYLRNIPLEDIDEPHDPPILTVENNPFRYVFYLLKPKIAAILNPSLKEIITEEKTGFTEIQNPDEIKEILEWGTDYRFLIICNDCEDNNIQKNNSMQPYAEMTRREITQLLEKSDNNEIVFEILKKAYKLDNEKIILIIHGDKHYYHYNGKKWEEINNTQVNNENLIVFDHHGDNADNYTNSYYYEGYPSRSTTAGIVTKIIDPQTGEKEKNKLLTELLISSTCKIKIIDERIHEIAKQENKNFQPMKIDIFGNIKNINQPADVTFVHLNLIEKKAGTDEKSIDEWIKTNSGNTKLIVISDRGTPSNIPEGTLYLPYESIFYSLFYARSKYCLFHLITSVRKLKKRR